MLCENIQTKRHENEDGTVSEIQYNCGHCLPCKINKQTAASVRVMMEMETSYITYFVHLTYDDEHVPITENGLFLTLDKKHVDQYLNLIKKQGIPQRYKATGEYGSTTGRPHYHLLIFCQQEHDISIFQNCWKHGLVQVDIVGLKEAIAQAKAKNTKDYSSKRVADYVGKHQARIYKNSDQIYDPEAKIGPRPEISWGSKRPMLGHQFIQNIINTIKAHPYFRKDYNSGKPIFKDGYAIVELLDQGYRKMKKTYPLDAYSRKKIIEALGGDLDTPARRRLRKHLDELSVNDEYRKEKDQERKLKLEEQEKRLAKRQRMHDKKVKKT